MKSPLFIILLSLFLFDACLNESKKKETNINRDNLKKTEHKIEEITNKTLLNGKLKLYLPEGFLEITRNELAEQFPNERQRPTLVFSNSEQVKLSINYGSSPAIDSDLPRVKQSFENAYDRSGIYFKESEIKVINGSNLVVMSFVLPNNAKGDQIVNEVFIGSLSGQLLLGSFSYPQSVSNEWESVGKKIIQSIDIKE